MNYDYTVPTPIRHSRMRVWRRRHHEAVIAIAIIAVFVLYLGAQIVRAHVAGRL